MKFSGFLFLDGYIDLTKVQQKPLWSDGDFSEIWSISHGMTQKIFHIKRYGQTLTAKYKGLAVNVETKYLLTN